MVSAAGPMKTSPASGGRTATAFPLELIAELQAVATVSMIDVRACSRFLNAWC
jgi:hypothetical protein